MVKDKTYTKKEFNKILEKKDSETRYLEPLNYWQSINRSLNPFRPSCIRDTINLVTLIFIIMILWTFVQLLREGLN